MSFLMSYKLSQDFLEVFFSALRSRGDSITTLTRFNLDPHINVFSFVMKLVGHCMVIVPYSIRQIFYL